MEIEIDRDAPHDGWCVKIKGNGGKVVAGANNLGFVFVRIEKGDRWGMLKAPGHAGWGQGVEYVEPID